MKRHWKTKAGLIVLLAWSLSGLKADPVGTAFLYQGELQDSGIPAVGDFDFEFRLYSDPNGVIPLGGAIALEDVLLTDGRFTAELDFGSGIFNGDKRWLEVAVRPGASTDTGDFVVLSPLQNLIAAPYALYAVNGGSDGSDHNHSSLDAPDDDPLNGLVVDNDGDVGIGTTEPFTKLDVINDNGIAVRGESSAPASNGVRGNASGLLGSGVFGSHTSATGLSYGVRGESASSSGRGVFGFAGNTNGGNVGVSGVAAGVTGNGVSGSASSITGVNNGVRGETASSTGRGVYGLAANASGINYGVQGDSVSTNGRGVYGLASSTTGVAYGVQGESASSNGRGVYGLASSAGGLAYGVEGVSFSSTGRGVFGWASSITGVNYGVYGLTFSPDGYAGYFAGGQNYFEGNVGVGETLPSSRLHITGGVELSLTDHGSLLLGPTTGVNLVIDTNEIQARNNGAADHLLMNCFGGNVGIGVGVGAFSPAAKLQVDGDSDETALRVRVNASTKFTVNSNGGATIGTFQTASPANGLYVSGNTGLGTTQANVRLDVNGSIEYTGTITDVSDKRLKENFEPLQNALKKVQALEGLSYTMKDAPNKREVGLIAQDVQAVLPEAVSTVDPENGTLGISYPSLIPLLVEAIKEQQNENRELRTRLEKIEAQLTSLK
jgi:hypothetical protein